jgi:type IV secretory pathway VirB2 component (pilin)
MIFANLKNGCKRACNLVKNSRAVRFCVLVAVCLTFNVATALAESGGGAGYEAGKNAISQASEQIAQYVPIATKLCYAIAGVVAIVGAISVYVKMNNEEQDVKKSIMMIIGACVFLIAAAQALPLFFGIEDGVITGF